jgi:hypothetical protein
MVGRNPREINRMRRRETGWGAHEAINGDPNGPP